MIARLLIWLGVLEPIFTGTPAEPRCEHVQHILDTAPAYPPSVTGWCIHCGGCMACCVRWGLRCYERTALKELFWPW